MKYTCILLSVFFSATSFALTTPETSKLFRKFTDPGSGVVSYILDRRVAVNQQSFYFTHKSMTEDGRFLLFEISGGARGTVKGMAMIDFEKDEIVVLEGVERKVDNGIAHLDVENDMLYHVTPDGFWKRDLRKDPQHSVFLCAIPQELKDLGRIERYFTRLTLTQDRRKGFMDLRIMTPTNGYLFVQGLVDFRTGRFEKWGEGRTHTINHGELNPKDENLALCAYEVAADTRVNGWYPRLQLCRPGLREMIEPALCSGAVHEHWTQDGKGFIYFGNGMTYHDLATGKQTRIVPYYAGHGELTADNRYAVFDYYVGEKWYRGCPWSVRFFNRDTNRDIFIFTKRPALPPESNAKALHPDPHPQFVCHDRYAVCTSNNEGGFMDLAVTPVAPLVAATSGPKLEPPLRNALPFKEAVAGRFTTYRDPMRRVIEGDGPVRIGLDRWNAMYSCGEKAVFSVSRADGNGEASPAGRVKWRLDNYGKHVLSSGVADLADGPFEVGGTLTEPGFLRLTVSDELGRKLRIYSAAYEPSRIRTAVPKPKDFERFWQDAAARLEREVPLDPQVERIDRLCRDGQIVSRVSFATFGGRRVYGVLTHPADAAKGPYPVRVYCPGAGPGWTLANCPGASGEIRLFMSVHGFPMPDNDRMRDELYAEQESRYRAIHGPSDSRAYQVVGLPVSRESAHLFPVVLGISRAVDWVAERRDADMRSFTYSGASQGGYLGLCLCALNRHFTRAYMGVPSGADVLGRRADGRQGGWSRILECEKQNDLQRLARMAANVVYFDSAFFAESIRIPVILSVGYSDETCAPQSVLAAFNAIPAKEKTLYHGIGGSHGSPNAPRNEVDAFLKRTN